MSFRVPARVFLLLGGIAAAPPLLAHDTAAPLCSVVLHEERTQRDEFALRMDLARSRLSASEEIFGLVERLWEEEATPRLNWLAARHDRDVDRLGIERRRLLLERQDAVVAQYELFCEPLISARAIPEERRGSIETEYSRYHRIDCEIRAIEIQIAETDLEYSQEVLVSYRDLRKNAVATRQDIIISERDVEMAKTRIEQAKRRNRECREKLVRSEATE